MKDLAGFSKEQVDVGRLAQVIRERERPVDVRVLAREAVREFLTRYGERRYAPGAKYVPSERILLDGEPVEVRAARQGGNPGQGDFTVLTLGMGDGPERWMAAEVAGAPAQDRDVTEDQIRSQMKGKAEPWIRAAVKAALDKDARFASFQFARGTSWCLLEILPRVGKAELKKVAAALPKRREDGEEPGEESTETLVRAVWGIENDGSARYERAEFALSRALKQYGEVQNVSGDLWVWKAAWDAFAQRDRVDGPHMPTQIVAPEGITVEATDSSRAGGATILIEVSKAGDEKDLEAWHDDHATMGVFTLSAQQYYKAWLPLNKDLRKLFPPLEAGKQKIVLRLNLLGYRESLPAWVDLYKGQILGKKQLYDALHDQGVYPGARLQLAFVSGGEYELATRPTTKAELIRVLTIRLEDGRLVAEEFDQPRRYDTDDDVYVADARFEDLKALFQQAERAGNSIFGLIYEKCVEWWEAQGRTELRVNAERLFEEIHFDAEGRMTSPATIGWELWRREAFKPLGGGVYRFCPERMNAVKVAARPLFVRRRPTKSERKMSPSRTLGQALGEMQAETEPDIGPEIEAEEQPETDSMQLEPMVAPVEAAAPRPAVTEPRVEEGTLPAEETAVRVVAEGPEPEAEGGQPDVMAPEPEVMMQKAEVPALEPEVVESVAEAGASPGKATGTGPGDQDPKAGAQPPDVTVIEPEAVVREPDMIEPEPAAEMRSPDTPTAEPEVVESRIEVTAPQPAVRGEGAHVAEKKAQAEKVGVDADAERTQSQRTEPRRAAGTPKETSVWGDNSKAPLAATRQQEPRKQRSSRSHRPKGQSQRIWDTFMELPPIRWLRRLMRRR